MNWRYWDQLTPILRRADFWDSDVHGGGFGPRYIQEFQILYVQSGRGEARIGTGRWAMEPGDLLYYGPNERHEVVPAAGAPLRLVGLVFLFRQDDDAIAPASRHSSPQPHDYPRGKPQCPLKPAPPSHVSAPPLSPIRRLCESLVISQMRVPDGRDMEKRGLLLMLFEVWREAIDAADRGPALAAPHRRAVQHAEQRIAQQLTQPPSLEQLARDANISSAYFGRLFKQHTGLSVRQYVAHQRLTRARRLLVEDTLNVSEVARAVGYDDPFYFSRLFTRQFGVSPSNLRQSRQMD